MHKINFITLSLSLSVTLFGCTEQETKREALDVELANQVCLADSATSDDKNENPLFKPNEIEPIKQLDPLLANIRARKTTSLNGDWRYIVDQLSIGDASPLLRGGVGEGGSYLETELLEYAFTDQNTLTVPGDWNTQAKSLFWYRGVVWYQRNFEYKPTAGKRTFIYFGGANFAKDVYINGVLIARHKGGFTPFNSEVTGYLKDGQNSIVVKVDSISGPAEIPTEYNDWLNYGGITRDVLLVDTAASFIQNYKIQLKAGAQDQISGWIQLSHSPEKTNRLIRLSIAELGIVQDLSSNSDGRIEFEFNAKPELWSPESPKLYQIDLSHEGITLSDEIGFRSIETSGKDILLNGKPVFLRGISMHEESLIRRGRANSREDAAAVIEALSQLNANFIRLAHYPHNEHIVRAADEAGILVWAEMPVYHNIQFDNPCTLQSAKHQYSELIARDQNRASVIFWSLGNETPETEARNRFFGSMSEHVRSLDDTRLTTAALLGFGGMEAIGKYLGTLIAAQNNKLLDLVTNPKPVTIAINDPLSDLVDVVGYNEYLGWYLSGILTEKFRENGLDVTEEQVRDLMLQEMEKITIESNVEKPLIISEFGAGARYGKRGEPTTIWSEDYQARVYQQQLKMLGNSDALRGISPWILKDFRAPYRLNTREQDYWNRKGLLSEKGEKKMAFNVLSQFYLDKKTSSK